VPVFDVRTDQPRPRPLVCGPMNRRSKGPIRTESINAYLVGTRILAALATLALAGGIVSDLVDGSFWQRHALLAGLSSSIIVVMLSVGIFNEAVERRRRGRWSVLAQYVMLDLVRNARLVWTGVLDWTGLVPLDVMPAPLVEVGAPIVRDRSQLAPALAKVISDPNRRRAVHDDIAATVVRSNEMLGRWAGVMLNSDLYAGVIDRHVELASDIAWLSSLLDSWSPPDDPKRHHVARASAAVQIEGHLTDEILVDRLVVIAQLAEELDRGTLELALRLVPVDWWRARLGAGAPIDLRVPPGS
jgi:hypothetical protein